MKIRNQQGIIVSDGESIKVAVQEFYSRLYTSARPRPARRPRLILNVGSEELPAISAAEVRHALRQMKNGKAPGEDQITAEMLKLGRRVIERTLTVLFNKCLEEGTIPTTWRNAEVILLFKKGDITNIENYRPISLLSHMYKLFTRILTNRMTTKLDFYQPVEQAGFRKGFSTMDHLQTVRSVMEKCSEYNVPLYMAFVDYKKAFDSVETWAFLSALEDARIDSRYTALIKNIYENGTFHVKVSDELKTDKITIGKGVRQGDPISPKLFTAALENVFKRLNWEDKGILIDGIRLNNLRFADDICLLSSDFEELRGMLEDLHQESLRVGLEMNLDKTKIMTPDNIPMVIDGQIVENVAEYVYLGQVLKLSQDCRTAEITRRIGQTWAAFGNLRHIFCNPRLPINLKRKVHDACLLPVATYGLETIALTVRNAQRLRVMQRAIERRMLGVSLRDRIRNEELRRRSKIKDVIERIAELKWSWAGHVARQSDTKWPLKILNWRPRLTKRSQGRPQLRWIDDIRRTAGAAWKHAAQCRSTWKTLGEAYVQEWTHSG